MWAAARSVLLTTLPPGDETSFVEDVAVEPGVTEVEHDVLLPTAEIHGVVRDADTGAPIAGASVSVSTSRRNEGSWSRSRPTRESGPTARAASACATWFPAASTSR